MNQAFARTTGYKENDLFCMSRVRGVDGVLLLAGDIDTIDYRVIEIGNADATATTGTLDPDAVIFDTPVETADDSRWPSSAPSGGYNFGGAIPGTAFPDGSKNYAIQIDATLTNSKTVTLYGGIHNTRVSY